MRLVGVIYGARGDDGLLLLGTAMLSAMAGALPGGTSTSTSGLPSAPDRQAVPEASRTGATAASDTFVREGDKVGRNDPCRMGRGKKYKKCHGA